MKLQNLDQNSFLSLSDVLVSWYPYSQRKYARFDKCSGSVRKYQQQNYQNINKTKTGLY